MQAPAAPLACGPDHLNGVALWLNSGAVSRLDSAQQEKINLPHWQYPSSAMAKLQVEKRHQFPSCQCLHSHTTPSPSSRLSNASQNCVSNTLTHQPHCSSTREYIK